MVDDYNVELLDVDKSYGGIRALNKARLQVKPKEVHALVGENGAGKSTLMKVLSGAVKKDGGIIKLYGKEVDISSPRDSINMGIAIIYQEFMLAKDLTVAENIFIGRLADGSPIIRWSKLIENTITLLKSVGFENIDPNAKIADLSIAHQQIVEICKSLSQHAKILVLDEPTSVLTFAEIKKLFDLIRKIKEHGTSVIYISHRLDEIFDLCDRVTVMKDGEYVDTFKVPDIDKSFLISKMIGREITDMFPKKDTTIGDVVLEVENVNAGMMVKNISFKLRKGEVFGFAGLVGSGRTETMRAIFGADKLKSGRVFYFGKEVRFKTPQHAVKKGFGFLPEDRKGQGVLVNQTIRVNTTLANMKLGKNKFNLFNKKLEIKQAKGILAKLNTKYDSTEDNVSSLSGGNQQKVSLAKWLAARCDVIILDEPTRGIDVGSKTEIYKSINNLAAQGIAIILISSEMLELIGVCDRVAVMRYGSIVGELKKEELVEENLISLAMGV